MLSLFKNNGIIGVGLFLIALYLVLEKSAGASSVIKSAAEGGGALAKTLQGR
jgi:hypothetical protein